jgi:hypothetical protein
MTYTKPTIERLSVVGHMITKASRCAAAGGKWDGQECYLPGQ